MKKITKTALLLASTLFVFTCSKATHLRIVNNSKTYNLKIKYYDLSDKERKIIVQRGKSKDIFTGGKRAYDIRYKQLDPSTGKTALQSLGILTWGWQIQNIPTNINENDIVEIKIGSKHRDILAGNLKYYKINILRGKGELIYH